MTTILIPTFRFSAAAALIATSITIAALPGFADDEAGPFACAFHNVRVEPSPSCIASGQTFTNCPADVCEINFEGCDEAEPDLVCEGSTCRCFDGAEEFASCDYDPNQCPMPDASTGDGSNAIAFSEQCCGAPVEEP